MPAGRLLCSLLIAWLGMLPCMAAPSLRLVAGEYPPFISAELPQQGPMVVEVQRLFLAIGYAPEMLPLVPWSRALAMVQSGQAEATFGWGYSARREQDFHSSLPFFRSPRKFFALASHKPQIGLEDLPGRSLCLPQGNTVPPEIEAVLRGKTVRLERPAYAQACLRMMVMGRVDYLLQSELVGQRLVEQAGLADKIRAASNVSGYADFHILLPRRNPASAVIVQRLNRVIEGR
jgi:polar amino acid transport system substrate-binding protein